VSLYAESRAVLAWLLDEEPAASGRELLAAQQIVVASDLTLVECDRVLQRAAALGELTEAEAADRRAHLAVARARQSFPGPPIRTVDAIHLASLPVARSAISGLALLSVDTRVRGAAAGLGIRLQPQYEYWPKDS